MTRPPKTRRTIGSPLIGVILAAVVVGLIALAFLWTGQPAEREDDALFEGQQELRPTGSGTLPDGPADSLRGGMNEGTVPDDVIDQTINTDNVPALLQSGGDPPASPTAEGLEPFGEDAEPILPQIADETEMEVPGVEEDEPGQ
jgi:hypothetical protein